MIPIVPPQRKPDLLALPLYLINLTYRVLISPLHSPTGIFSYFPYVPLLYTKSPHAFTYSIAPDGDLLAGYSTFRSKQQMYLDSLLIFDPIIYRTTNTKLSDITGGYLLCTIASHVGGGTLSVFEEMTHSLGIVLPLLVYIKLHGMRMCPQEV